MCKMMISPELFFIFWKFWFFGLLESGGIKGQQNSPKRKTDYICHVPYLRNSIEYDHYFWYTCAKWWYLQAGFSFFQNFDFWVVGGVKGQKVVQNDKKILSVVLHISGTIHYIIVIYGTLVYLQGFFSFIKSFDFVGC